MTAVWVPDEQTEALRDLERSRDDAKNAERVVQHQLDKFLLRNERVYRDGRSWTTKHSAWLKQQKFDDPCKQCVMDDDVKAVEDATERVKRLSPAGAFAPAAKISLVTPDARLWHCVLENRHGATDQVMRFRPANISLNNSRYLPRRRLGGRRTTP